jgi:N-acetylglucosamine transport system permease protein
MMVLSVINRRKHLVFWSFSLPALALYLYLVVVPFFQTFYYSLTDWNGISDTMNFVGLKNFTKLLQDQNTWKYLWNNTLFFVIGGILTYGIGLFNAVVLTQSKLKEKRFYRIVFFFPNVLSIAIVAVLWMFIYNPTFGILNATLRAVGLDHLTRVWLGDKSTVVYAMIVPWVWMSVGFYMVLFISSIEGIPTSLFEAAEIDGANSVQRFTRITFPLLWETIRTSIVFFVINAFSGVFTLVNVMTNGEPAGASEVLTNHMYKTAFQYSKFGYATAIGVFVFLVIMLIAGVLLLLTRSKDVIEY